MITAELTIGESWYPSVGEFQLSSWRVQPLTILKAKVPLAPIEMGDDVTFRYGYADPATWTGTVFSVSKGGDVMTVRAAKSGELKLLDTSFKESFVEETAESIVKTALARTGLTIATIDAPGVTIPRYTADDISVCWAVRQVENTLLMGYGLAGYALWLSPDGLRWTTGDEPGDIPEIETGVNLVDNAPDILGFSRVTAFLLPGLTHSRRFKLTDTRRGITGTYRAESVSHELRDRQARTLIYYRMDT